MKPTTFRMRNKQRLMALMIAGTVVGLGYQADIAQADTTAVESGDSTDQSSTTSTATAKTVTLSQQSPTTTENDAAETNSSTSEKTPAAATTPIAKPIAKPAAVTPQVRAISTPTATAPQSTNSSAVTPTTTASIVKTGTFGTAPWTLDSDGNMVISAGTFRGGELGSYNHTDVKHVTFAGKVVLGTDASRLFSGWSSLTGIDGLANLDTSQTVLMDDMFSQTGLQQLDLSSANWDTSHVLDMSSMFANNPALTAVNVAGLDTSQVTNMTQMFFNDPLLATITGTGDWNTGQVTDMNAMFANDSMDWDTWQTAYNDVLQTVDVANWDTSHVTDMRSMFTGNRALTQLDLSHWQTSHVKYLAQLFADDAVIDHLDVSHWDVGQVLNTTSMFENATALTTIDLSQWNPTAIRAMNNMFAGDRSLTKLDLSNIDMNAVSSLNHLLQGTISLRELKLGTNSHLFDGEDQVNLLDAPTSATFTGKWQAVGSGQTYTAADLNTGYDGATMADTYVWEKVATTTPDNNDGDTTTPDNTGTAPDTSTPTETPESGGSSDTITIPDTGTPVKSKPATGGSAAQIDSRPANKMSKAQKVAMHPQALAKPVTGAATNHQVTTNKTVRLTARTNKNKSVKPAATVLPQTAEASTSWLTVLGVLGLSLVGLHWFKKQD
ncbi:BspA family leucine-rich repeat surface protein [Levilactobacillus brevis]|nr:BspA family leucine-rich repeat surface protein [Levilactobacillus brevis]MCM6798215.1 BspA family leucine-rich repeat surface protein [Levilactobacillus brevis]MCM6800839.1 BspA family leucine-rich repeat surface protein [Levilactobacillus brevis]MCM6806322.1 BspA family leucine-rich repeat surface protein [Levilactobacillus brevis]MCM6808503.1 BspA family leucine-rich repeat surface protein [Levilactobacillus brevis]MCM6814390.1 BspA family leucine-rich repeat surface protein [Levilactoba